MRRNPVLYKSLVIGVIFLFVGVGIQPAIANISGESEKSELERVTIQFYETDKTYNHTVMMTKEQLIELENLIKNIKTQINSIDNPIESEEIFKNAIISFNDLGLLPNDMSIEYTQQLVTGKERNKKFINILETWYDKEKKTLDEIDELNCLIIGDSKPTVFQGPIPLLLHAYIQFWVNNPIPLLWLIQEFTLWFWYLLSAGLTFFPLKFGAFISFGLEYFDGLDIIFVPAEGWVSTISSSGLNTCSGRFSGYAIGFSGIKIFKGFFNTLYLGVAFKVHIENE